MTHPRGNPTWPEWKTATPGTRVRNVVTGYTGTLRRVSPGRRGGSAGNKWALIQWDNDALGRPVEPGTGVTGRVVAPAFDLEVI